MATEADVRRVVREELTAFLDRPVGKYHNDKTITVRGGLGGGARYAFWALTTLMGLRPIIEAGLTEEEKAEIAKAAADAVPEEIAADVVAELSERLTIKEGTPS